MSARQETLESLASRITELTQEFTTFLRENSVTEPSFAADSCVSYSHFTPESFTTRQHLCDALMDMWYLVQGPSESIFNYAHTAIPDAACLSLLNHFDFWSAVPLNASATVVEISKQTKLPPDVVRRVLQHAFTLRLFEKAESNDHEFSIRHTSRSAALARVPGLRALVSTVLDDAGAPMLIMSQALAKFSSGKSALTQNMDETAFALLYSGGNLGNYKNSWEFIENDGDGANRGWRSRNFVQFMDYLKDLFHLEQVLVTSLDWEALGAAKVVDLGGSGGHDAFVLARKYPDLSIVVQDMPQVKSVFEKNVPDELKDRVTYDAHDIFMPQHVQADVYLVKLILHDYTDRDAAAILKALIPSLKAGARILLIEYVGKDEDAKDTVLPRSVQQMGTATDLRMMALFNAEERPVRAWENVFKLADERFEISRVKAEPLTFFVVIEVTWRG